MCGTCIFRYGPGSSITLAFDKDTDTPSADTKAQVDQLVTFSGPIGRNYTATWPSRRQMRISIIDSDGHANYHDGGFVATLALAPQSTHNGDGDVEEVVDGTLIVGLCCFDEYCLVGCLLLEPLVRFTCQPRLAGTSMCTTSDTHIRKTCN
jgi:hypothetical protein